MVSALLDSWPGLLDRRSGSLDKGSGLLDKVSGLLDKTRDLLDKLSHAPIIMASSLSHSVVVSTRKGRFTCSSNGAAFMVEHPTVQVLQDSI